MEKPTKIIENIYIGNLFDGNDDSFLVLNNIAYIFRFLCPDEITVMKQRYSSLFPVEKNISIHT